MKSSLKYWEENIPWTFRDVTPRPSYEERRRMRYELQDYMAEVIPFAEFRGKKVLEVGSGSGIDAAEFARNGAIISAIDATKRGVRETVETLSEAGVDGGVWQATATNTQCEPESKDLVYCFGVLHHLKSPCDALDEFWRVLKPDGQIIAMVYNRESLLYAYSIRYLNLNYERIPNVPHVQAYTKEELMLLLGRFSFSEVTIGTYYNVIDTKDQRKVKLCIPDSLGLGWHHIVKCRK